MAGPRIPLADRFWSKVLKTDTCWLWQRQLNNKGYGCFAFYSKTLKRRSSNMYAHRVAWLLTNGPIADRMNVLHRCDTPACCNPEHLFLGTQKDNMADCGRKGRKTLPPLGAKVSEQDVRNIRADTRKHHVIAADYGLKRCAVWNIKSGRTWKHVT